MAEGEPDDTGVDSLERPTRLEDLARRAGVSISTVSRALNDSPVVNLRTKEAIWRLARELDYPFRRYMPAAPIGAEATIALIVPRPQGRASGFEDPFFAELLAGVSDAARERGCDIVVSHRVPSSEAEVSAALTASRADGAVFLGQGTLHTAFNALADSDSRFVVWGAQLPDQRYCSVGGDNQAGGRRATRHLARLGRRRIVFLGDIEAIEPAQRHRGYLDALNEFSLPVDPQLLVPAHFEVESAEAAIDRLVSRGVAFDGLVAASDLIALGALRALHRGGRSVPGDVAVIGYDDVAFSRYSTPALTTVRQDTRKAGRLLIAKLLDGEGDGAARSERVQTELVVRESCGA